MPKSRGRKPKKKKAQQTAVASKKSAPLTAVASKKSTPLTAAVASKKSAPLTAVASKKSAWFLLPSRLFVGFLAICTIVGLIVFWPRLIVEAVGQIDPLRPFPITFKITNTGFIPLDSVQPAIGRGRNNVQRTNSSSVAIFTAIRRSLKFSFRGLPEHARPIQVFPHRTF